MHPTPSIDQQPRTDIVSLEEDPMPLPRNPVVLLLGGILAMLAIFLLRIATEIAIPIIMAFMMYLVLQPAVRLLLRYHLPRGLAALVVMLTLCGVVGALTLSLANPVSEWAGRLPATLEKAEQRFSEVSRIVRLVQRAGRQVEAKMSADEPRTTSITVQGPALSSQILTSTREMAVGLATTVILLFFLLLSGDVFLRRLVEILPTLTNKKQAVEITGEVRTNISAYLLTITSMNAGVGVVTCIAAWACGLPDPVLWGSVAFFCNYIPFLGPLLASGLLLVVGVATFTDPWLAVLPMLLYIAIHLIEGQFVTPLLLARRFILNPVIVIVAVLFWYWMWGIPGAVLAVPMLATVKIVCDRIRGLAAFGHFLAAEPRTAA